MDAPSATTEENEKAIDNPANTVVVDSAPLVKPPTGSTFCIWTCPLIMLFFAVAMWFVFGDYAFLYDIEKYESLYHDKDVTYIPLGIHMFTAVICLVTGPIQLILGWLGRGRLPWHRWQGRLYVGCMIISIPMAYTCCILTQNGNWQRYSLMLLATFWTGTLIPAVYYVKKGKIKLHREFMMRNYAATFAFVTFRVGLMFGGTHSPLPLIGILINMMVIELKIQSDNRGWCQTSKRSSSESSN